MQPKYLLAQIAIAVSLAIPATAAQADVYTFKLTGDYTATWQMESTSYANSYEDGWYSTIWVDTQIFPGGIAPQAELTFYHAGKGGGFDIFDFGSSSVLLDAGGEQLYTGGEASPTFKLGSFALTAHEGPGAYTLTVSLANAVPEPASVALMLGGLCGIGAVLARRRVPAAAPQHA